MNGLRVKRTKERIKLTRKENEYDEPCPSHCFRCGYTFLFQTHTAANITYSTLLFFFRTLVRNYSHSLSSGAWRGRLIIWELGKSGVDIGCLPALICQIRRGRPSQGSDFHKLQHEQDLADLQCRPLARSRKQTVSNSTNTAMSPILPHYWWLIQMTLVSNMSWSIFYTSMFLRPAAALTSRRTLHLNMAQSKTVRWGMMGKVNSNRARLTR